MLWATISIGFFLLRKLDIRHHPTLLLCTDCRDTESTEIVTRQRNGQANMDSERLFTERNYIYHHSRDFASQENNHRNFQSEHSYWLETQKDGTNARRAIM